MANIYDRIVAFSERLAEDYAYANQESAPETSTLIADNMMRQLESDPDFEAKFDLLEKQNITIGVSDDPRMSNKNMDFWRVEFEDKQFGQDDFSVLDQSLDYMTDMHESAARSLKHSLENPPSGTFPDQKQEIYFLQSSRFLQQANEAGLNVNVPHPFLGPPAVIKSGFH